MIDNDDVTSTLITEHFVDAPEDWDIVVVTTLSEARIILLEHRFDIVILDMHLSDGTALNLLKEVAFTCPVIVITTNYEPTVRMDVITYGASLYLTKASECLAELPELSLLFVKSQDNSHA